MTSHPFGPTGPRVTSRNRAPKPQIITQPGKRFGVSGLMDHAWGGMRWRVIDTVENYALEQGYLSQSGAQAEADRLNA